MTKSVKADVRPSRKALSEAISDDKRNRRLLAWLSDDDDRRLLFGVVRKHFRGSLSFKSRDPTPSALAAPGKWPTGIPRTGHKTVELVTDRGRIETALTDKGTHYANAPYADIGGGNFMLAINVSSKEGRAAHGAQMKALYSAFPQDASLERFSEHACRSAAILALQRPEFDLATFAEQSALRFCQNLFGYALSDYRLLESASRNAYRALVHQVLGRHFVTDPAAVPAAKQEMGKLLLRTGTLIDAYAANDKEALAGCDIAHDLEALADERVLCKLAKDTGELNGEQRAVIAIGAVAGTVGNVQAAVCIAVQHFFSNRDVLEKACAAAKNEHGTPALRKLIGEALSLNPPIPFLPRAQSAKAAAASARARGNAAGPAADEVILALGGDTRAHKGSSDDDSWIWGLAPPTGFVAGSKDPPSGRHWCIGRALAWPLIVETVRQVMRLPGLSEAVDPFDGSTIGLELRFGFACERYRLLHRRDERVAQSTLNVAMRIKSPSSENAERLREVIRAGAPRIDEALRESRHVHFAWFEFIERDTVLVLHTVYDGDNATYLRHFAESVGHLFDKLFEWIEDPPPMPIARFSREFVAHIQRHNRAPAMGYFFSAYPNQEVARIPPAPGRSQ